jgi:hypothetical protein
LRFDKRFFFFHFLYLSPSTMPSAGYRSPERRPGFPKKSSRSMTTTAAAHLPSLAVRGFTKIALHKSGDFRESAKAAKMALFGAEKYGERTIV